jgi:methyl-accepting chemotaxis protein
MEMVSLRYLVPRWFLALSIQWKLQLGFFVVTMVTIIVNRLEGYSELEKLIQIAKDNNVNAAVIQELNNRLSTYVTASLWQSAAEFVILFLIISALAKLFTLPIKNLCRALAGIEKGDLTHAVENRSSDEIGILEYSFNAMLSNLTSVFGDCLGGGVEVDGAADDLGLRPTGGAAYQDAKARQQFLHLEGFDQIIDGAGL